MRLTDGTESVEVSVTRYKKDSYYGDCRDPEDITCEALGFSEALSIRDTPHVVSDVRKTMWEVEELSAEDLGYDPETTELSIDIRFLAPDISEEGRGLPDGLRLEKSVFTVHPFCNTKVEYEVYESAGGRLCHDLQGLDLRGRDLRYINLHDMDISRTCFADADLRGAIIGGVKGIDGADFSNADMRRAIFAGKPLEASEPVRFDGADLRGADFIQTMLDGMFSFDGADMTGARLRQAQFIGLNMRNINLTDADIAPFCARTCDMSGAILTRSNMRNAILKEVRMSDANVDDADLTGLHATHGYMRRIDFTRANHIDNMVLENIRTSDSLFPEGYIPNHCPDPRTIAEGKGWRLKALRRGDPSVRLVLDWRDGCPYSWKSVWFAGQPWRGVADNRIIEIRFVPGSKAPEDMRRFFSEMPALRKVDFTNLDMSDTRLISWMFDGSGREGYDIEIVGLDAPKAEDVERITESY